MNRNITATILIVLAAGIYFTVTQSAWTSAKQVKMVNDQYISAIANAQQLIKVRDKVLNDYNNVSQGDRDRLAKMLPSTVDNIRLIIDLNNVAIQHGISLKNVRAAAASSQSASAASAAASQAASASVIGSPALDTVDVTFTVTAPYQQFISFMQDLESDLRIMDIKHLTVSVGDNGMYSFQVNMTTYWLRQ
jgi:Tfp pilus assembly protein PilO